MHEPPGDVRDLARLRAARHRNRIDAVGRNEALIAIRLDGNGSAMHRREFKDVD